MTRTRPLLRALAMSGGLFIPVASFAGVVVEDLGKSYTPDPGRVPAHLQNHLPDRAQITHGNTSFRNEAADTLVWKGKQSPNGFGYYQRNRDLGQVVNIPEGQGVRLDAVVLRTSMGDNALMAGAPGAPVYVQLFEVVPVEGEELRIDDNGTPVGTRSKHGFDRSISRTDDFIRGVGYVPLARATGGTIPAGLTPTTQPAYPRPNIAHGEQPGHLRYLRWDLTGDDEWMLEGGKRYALVFGFEASGRDRGIALAISTTVHRQEPPEFVRDANGEIRWGVRREGNGLLPPTMLGVPDEPTDPAMVRRLKEESVFSRDHWDHLVPTSEGYPDVDTYRTLQFYLETHPTDPASP